MSEFFAKAIGFLTSMWEVITLPFDTVQQLCELAVPGVTFVLNLSNLLPGIISAVIGLVIGYAVLKFVLNMVPFV